MPTKTILFYLTTMFVSHEVFAESVRAQKVMTLCEESVRADASITIDGSKMTQIDRNTTPSTEVSKTYHTITPGFFALGAHMGLAEVDAVPDTNNVNSKDLDVSASFDPSLMFDPRSEWLPVMRQEGILRALIGPQTSARLFAGLATVVRLDRIEGWKEKAYSAAFMDISAYGSSDFSGSKAVVLQKLKNAFEDARTWQTFPTDYQKANLKKLAWSEQDLSVISEILKGNIKLVVTVHRASDIEALLAFFQSYDRVKWIVKGGDQAWMLADKLARRNIPVLIDPLANIPLSFDQLGARLDNAALLYLAGVTIAFYMSPDAHGSASGLRQAAGVAVSNGLPWIEGLKAMTTNPRKIFLGGEGCLAPGSEATFVAWSGDPLDVSSSVESIWVKGKPISLETRQSKLRDKYAQKLKLRPVQ